MQIDFTGVPAAEQEGIRRLFEGVVRADAEKDAEALLALLAPDVTIEVQGLGVLDRRACELSIREQVRTEADSRMEYPTLYVELKDGVYRVEGTYRGWADGKLEYEGSLQMRLKAVDGRFFIAYEKMIPSLHGGESLGG